MIKDKNPFWKGKKFLRKKFINHVNRCHPNIRSIKIVIERRDGFKTEVPLTKYEIFEMSDLGYEGIIYNKEKMEQYGSFWRKIEHIEHDIISDGKTYTINKNGTFKLNKCDRFYLKKPKWKKDE